MKDLFPGYFIRDTDLERIWKTCIFAFDANILLNFYRYSEDTTGEFMGVLDALKDRIWLPYKAAEEYLEHRAKVISDQVKAYDKTIKAIDDLKESLKSDREHPFVSEKTLTNAFSVFETLSKELENSKDKHRKKITNDELKESISELFSQKVGPPYDRDSLKKVISEGKERFEEKIPPGYMDISKDDQSECFSKQYREYGDFIIWKQIIDKAVEPAKDLIFVTDDRKADWWEIINGITVGPRPELIREFFDSTGKAFYMYRPDRFLKWAAKLLDKGIDRKAVEEVFKLGSSEEMTKKTQEQQISGEILEHRIYRIYGRLRQYKDLLAFLEKKRSQLEERRDELRHRIAVIKRDYHKAHYEGGNRGDIDSLRNHLAMLEEELLNLEREFDEVSREFQEIKRMQIMLEQELNNLTKSL